VGWRYLPLAAHGGYAGGAFQRGGGLAAYLGRIAPASAPAVAGKDCALKALARYALAFQRPGGCIVLLGADAQQDMFGAQAAVGKLPGRREGGRKRLARLKAEGPVRHHLSSWALPGLTADVKRFSCWVLIWMSLPSGFVSFILSSSLKKLLPILLTKKDADICLLRLHF